MDFEILPSLQKILKKLSKKDSLLYNAIRNKIEEILHCTDITTYKHLRKPLQTYQGIHITGSFVLLFKYNKQKDSVIFTDFDHIDRVYDKKG
ncbi:MAG: addiction module toxin RelE [Candidatus Woesearchaeota archaeon]